MSTIITENELNQTLSVLSRPDRLAWFMAQPKGLQQDIALLIKTESIEAASARIKAIENCQTMWEMKNKAIEEKKAKAAVKKTRIHKDKTGMIRHLTIVGMITRIEGAKRPVIGLEIETEYGPIVIKSPRLDSKYLILFVEDGAIVGKSLCVSDKYVKPAINFKQLTFPDSIPHVYDLVVQYNHEQTLSA